jgi:hypothetical protein
MVSETKTSYKRLGFVEYLAVYAWQSATYFDKLYSSLRTYVPSSLQPYLTKAEDVVTANTASFVTSSQDFGGKALHVLDDKVDYLITTFLSSKTAFATVHDQNLHHYYSAMKTYFDAVIKQGDWVADKLSPIKTVQAARDSLHAAVAASWDMTDLDKAVETVHQAWLKFASVPAVSSLLSTAEPYTQPSFGYLQSAHDWLVANPMYKKTLDSTSASLRWYLETPPARMAKSWIYPALAPIADPALDKLSKSRAVQQAMEYWKPTATPVPAAA